MAHSIWTGLSKVTRWSDKCHQTAEEQTITRWRQKSSRSFEVWYPHSWSTTTPRRLEHMGEKSLPSNFKNTLIVKIFKKVDKSDFGNYHGISLISTPGKVLVTILQQLYRKFFLKLKAVSDTIRAPSTWFCSLPTAGEVQGTLHSSTPSLLQSSDTFR